MIIKKIPGRLLGANCYVVGSRTTGQGLIIDPCADVNTVIDVIDEFGLSISLMVATHSHIDHISETQPLKQKLSVDLAVHEAEADVERFSRDWAVQLGLPLEVLPTPDRLLRDGDVLETGDLKFSVLHTPGHSPGGISLAGYGMVFTGDTLLRGNVGSTTNYGGNFEALIESVSTILAEFPEETVVLPGHGHRTTIGTELRRMGLTADDGPSNGAYPNGPESKDRPASPGK